MPLLAVSQRGGKDVPAMSTERGKLREQNCGSSCQAPTSTPSSTFLSRTSDGAALRCVKGRIHSVGRDGSSGMQLEGWLLPAFGILGVPRCPQRGKGRTVLCNKEGGSCKPCHREHETSGLG